MGTITRRARKDGSTAYRVGIVIKQNGKVVHKEAKSFDREVTARAWMTRRERDLHKPGGLEDSKANKGTVANLITVYLKDLEGGVGRTKAQVLRTIQDLPIGENRVAELRSEDIVSMARELKKDRAASTVSNYLAHLSSVLKIAEAGFGYNFDLEVMRKAQRAAKSLELSGKSNERERRPSQAELDLLMQHFIDRTARGRALPMHVIIAFAIFSTRRQDEIYRLAWSDFEPQNGRILVRDMKHPGQRKGNNVFCTILPEAARIIAAMPSDGLRIFPYTADAISKAFTDACKLLEIDDLHFHDLRHEGVSWLFGNGMTIPIAAKVSGHRTWKSLQRYSQIETMKDDYENWKWWPAIEEWQKLARSEPCEIPKKS